MINILINGALGRMGRKIFDLCANTQGVTAVCGVDIKEDLSNPNYPVYDCINKVTEKVDVVIDFSSPSGLDKTLNFITKNNIPAVLSTTGYSPEQVEKIKQASKQVAIFRSANMSLGVNVLTELVKKASKALFDFDIEIIEKHHNQKVDAPSGTALMLADAVKDTLPEKFYVYGREGIACKRDKNEVGIHAIRGGNIVGEHQVIFAGENETITLTHQATDRGVFAVGALKAAIYIADKKPGVYDMFDLLKD